MGPVGVIANPASGKDIRRLVAHGSVFDNTEKVSIIRRVLTGLDAVGVGQVWLTPDCHCLGQRALSGLALGCQVGFLAMEPGGDQDDSRQAAALLDDLGAACIVTLGGDGTNRAVAKASGRAPLAAISTGTNNVFPVMVEGTLAGMAAGLLAVGAVDRAQVCRQAPRLEVLQGGQVVDIALVDLAVTSHGFAGARAIWRADELRQIVLTRAAPTAIGLSAVGGCLCPLPPDAGKGLHLTMGPGGRQVLAPIAPGLLVRLAVADCQVIEPGRLIELPGPAMLALDGERELSVAAGETLHARLSLDGPWVLDMAKTLELAAANGFFADAAPQVD